MMGMLYDEGRRLQDVAVTMGVSVSTVQRRERDPLSRLARRLQHAR